MVVILFMIDYSDALIIGGNVYGLYAGILLEKNGMDVTILENDLYNSMMVSGPLFFHAFSEDVKKPLYERSLSIYNELSKNKKGSFIWPIELYDKLRKNFNGKTLNFIKVESIVKDGKSVKGVRTNKGEINSKLILVLDGIITKNLLYMEKIDIKSIVMEYGNVIAEIDEKFNISMFNEKIIFNDKKFAYFSAPWKNSRVEFLISLFSEMAKEFPGIEKCLVRRVWKSNHDHFHDSLPRIGNVHFENAYFLAGYSRYGISFGLELTRLITQLALGKPTDFDVSKILF